MWGILFLWGPRLLGGFGQPRTSLFVRPLVAALFVGAISLQGRLYRSMLYQHRNGLDPFLEIVLPVQLVILLILVIRAARLLDRTRVPQGEVQ